MRRQVRLSLFLNNLIGGQTATWSRLVTLSQEGRAFLWDAKTGDLTAILRSSGYPIDEEEIAVFTQDGSRVITRLSDNVPCLWDAETGILIATFLPTNLNGRFNLRVNVISSSGSRVLSVFDPMERKPYRIYLWDGRTGDLISEFPCREEQPTHGVFSADETLMVTEGGGNAHVWHTKSGTQIGILDRGEQAIFSPDTTKVINTWGEEAT